MGDLYALDFDGVLCDSCGENSQSAVKAAKARWSTIFNSVDSALEDWVLEQMYTFDGVKGKLLVLAAMEVSNGGNIQNGMEKLVGNKYKYWRMCMKAYLQGQDLWELVAGADAIPPDVPENAESRRKWKIKCGKALFALRTSISKEFIDHVRDVSSPKEVWETLKRLFSMKNTARLQLLENELAMLKQGVKENF